MLNNQRLFLSVLRKYCAERGIAIEVRADGWLVVMQHGARKHFAYGYDIGLNSAISHRIANDKAAAAEILSSCGIPCVPHHIFLKPDLLKYATSPSGGQKTMFALLDESPDGVVVKPNEGTSGSLVSRARTRSELESAVNNIFSANMSVAISPYLAIEDEIRVILIDAHPAVVYSKQRPSVTGDGVRALRELIAKIPNAERLSIYLSGTATDPELPALDTVLPAGQSLLLNWRHNLDSGAVPILLKQGAVRESCVGIATRAMGTIGMRFGSVDVVRVDNTYRILEINSGVMMEALGRLHPDLVYATYRRALDEVFKQDASTK